MYSLQIENLISNLPSKFGPIDFLPISVFKMCRSELSHPASMLANEILSFTQGCFPASLKMAQVSPLLKKPNLDPQDPANYRPISNLNTIGKKY